MFQVSNASILLQWEPVLHAVSFRPCLAILLHTLSIALDTHVRSTFLILSHSLTPLPPPCLPRPRLRILSQPIHHHQERGEPIHPGPGWTEVFVRSPLVPYLFSLCQLPLFSPTHVDSAPFDTLRRVLVPHSPPLLPPHPVAVVSHIIPSLCFFFLLTMRTICNGHV